MTVVKIKLHDFKSAIFDEEIGIKQTSATYNKIMELQNYLRVEGLEKLAQTYNIKVNRHSNFENLVCLKYSQVESPLGETIVQQCRGIILDESNNWQIVSYPYQYLRQNKFTEDNI